MRDSHPLVIVQPHLFGKEQGEAVQSLECHLRLVLWGDADFDAQELVFAAAVVVVDQLHLLVDLLRRFATQVVEGEDPAELSLAKNVLQRVVSVRDGLTLRSCSSIFKRLNTSLLTRYWGLKNRLKAILA